MIKAVFLDFYGTVVHEDNEIVKEITQRIFITGNAEKQSDISFYWWSCFQSSCKESKGESFINQRELELISLQNTIRYFSSTEDASELSMLMFEFWMKPTIFEDSKMFFKLCPVPIIIVSNIDTDDIIEALTYHGLQPYGVVTSEEARAYKPQAGIFKYALTKYDLKADEVVHIGDSVTSDVLGAKAAGIDSIWANRFGKPVPDGVNTVVASLLDVLELKCIQVTNPQPLDTP
jgi:2-haloacid dehalogenase/putative hydrolase of the HAD superfamily